MIPVRRRRVQCLEAPQSILAVAAGPTRNLVILIVSCVTLCAVEAAPHEGVADVEAVACASGCLLAPRHFLVDTDHLTSASAGAQQLAAPMPLFVLPCGERAYR